MCCVLTVLIYCTFNIFLVLSNNEHPQNAGIALPASDGLRDRVSVSDTSY